MDRLGYTSKARSLTHQGYVDHGHNARALLSPPLAGERPLWSPRAESKTADAVRQRTGLGGGQTLVGLQNCILG